MSRPKKKSSAGSILFTAAIVFLSFTLIITIVTAIHTYQDQLTWYNYHEDEDGLIRDYTYGNFAELMTEAYSDANIDRRYTDTEMCLHAVAEYYEAATLVRAFEAAGDERERRSTGRRWRRFRRRWENSPTRRRRSMRSYSENEINEIKNGRKAFGFPPVSHVFSWSLSLSP